jgi:predicted MFS family arabinose efflux permease
MLEFRRMLPSPAARRGFLLLSIMTFAFGMSLSAQENIVTNFFQDDLSLTGPQFGYITSIREVPGFLLIFLMALFYKMSIPRLTGMMLLVLAVGFIFYGTATSFWTVVPWVIISSMGYHTVLQTQYALGLSLTTEDKAGQALGRMSAFSNLGALVAMAAIVVTFHFELLDFPAAFALAGVFAFIAALAIFRFPNLHDGIEQPMAMNRPRMVLKRPYRYYYYLHLLDGARMQIFFSFGLFVLVAAYGMSVVEISLLLVATKLIAMVTSPWIGGLIDRYGEKPMLSVLNVAYIVALAGYALVDNVYVVSTLYLVYAIIFPLSSVGTATYIRKIATREDVAPSLAMGVTLSHATAVVVPVTAGFILNFVGYQVPFLIACVFACFSILVTRRLDPANQKAPARIAEDQARERVVSSGAPVPSVSGGER